MSDEDWDNDEYVPQPVKFASDSLTSSLTSQQGRGGARGRGQRGRGAPGQGRQQNNRNSGDADSNNFFRNRGRGGSGRHDDNRDSSNFSRGRGRGGEGRYHEGDRNRNNTDNGNLNRGRGRGGVGRSYSNDDGSFKEGGGFIKRGRGRGTTAGRHNDSREHEDNHTADNNSGFLRSRGRGRSLRGNNRRVDGRTEEEEKWESDDETSTPRGRGLTPPRGARGRTRSSSGRLSESGVVAKKEEVTRGRGRGRGRRGNLTSRSDGEESDKSDEDRRSPGFRGGTGRGRPRQPLRSKSFRDTTSSGWEGRGRIRSSRGAGRGWRGRGGSGKPGGEEERKPPENYIPPEPTEDEDVLFHSGISTGVHFSRYDTIGVKVTGEKVPQPIESFESGGLCHLIVENIRKSGYKKPTPVQKNSLPIISAGRDLMACAQTGSGKTAAFLIPVIDNLLGRLENCSSAIGGNWVEPLAVILGPTRELAIQTFKEARKFAHGSPLKIALVYGGTVVEHQLNQIKRGCHVLVAVPGRLESFLKDGHIKFSRVRFFVLDEADRMLELGFKESVKRILSHDTVPKQGSRTTLMFSATFPQEIQELASTYLQNYLFLAVGEVGGACSDVQQLFHKVAKFDKMDRLLEILKDSSRGDELTLVFVSMKRHADFLAVYLCENDLQTTSIHGARYQSQREEALADFKSGARPILIATAVAARGLDIKNVAHVINYDLPNTIEEYVHRIGRTGRVGNCGKSTSFYDPGVDRPLAKHLLQILTQANQPVPEFLKAEVVGTNYSDCGVDDFAGTDIRTANSGGIGSKAGALDDEECWD